MSALLARFDLVAGRHGEQIAVRESAQHVTFAQLRERVEQQAMALQARGVGPGSLVPIEQPRSIAFIVEALATWRVGAAFLPLDPATPGERRAAIRQAARGASAPPAPDALAYVIYTSGSTGRPKGVRVGQAGLLPVLEAQIQAFGLGPGKRALWLLSPGFDASLSDIGTALLSGATLCIPPALGPRELVAYLAAERVTHADLPPSLLPLLGELPACMEVIVIGGEVCPPDVVRQHARRRRVINVYGPTEATICTSLIEVDPLTWRRPLLGHPLPHVRYRVLDAHQRPTREGELYIGGVALALGYIDQPALDARKFPTIDGERLYRTGDRVRVDDDGELVFLGRVDRQRKVRGQLVAPEEIEACLHAHPAVVEASVVARTLPRPGREPREVLVAFVSLAPSPPDPDAPDLAQSHALDAVRQHLRRQLPAALCPVLVPVEGLPRGSSGKVDLAALESAPLTPATRAPAGPAAPFAALFARVLGLDAVGEEDSFFDLGGDSIAALELLAEAALVGLPLPADALYRAPTPAALARHLGPPAASIADLTARAVEALREASPGRRDHGASAIEHALVTGATGFFGAWLLAELLARTKWTFHTLVRAPDRAAAQDRVERALAAVSRVTGRAAPAGRVVAWPGDATRERLGLAAAEHERLHRQVGAVIHGAAELHLLKPYEALREANVTAAARVSQLGADRAMFHHISTLSVLVATDHPAATLDERADPRDARRVYGGYAQSKWAAEEALRRGGHDAFHRLGLLTGDTLTGRPAAACPLAQLLRGLAALGCVPRGDHAALRVDITPVDHAARAVATLIAQGPMRSAAHVASARGASLAGLLAALRAEGARCDEVSADEFLRRARRQLPFAVTMAMLSLPRLLGGGEVQRDVDLFQLTGRTLDCAGTERRTGLPHPAIDETLLRRYARAALEEP